MSTEQDKESFSFKRNRGGDGALDGLGGPGVLLGSPDKKRRKSNTQVAAAFGTLSEYAPPPNTSSDHLVALNPFDDNYNESLKPPNNPYFGASQYPGFGGYGMPRMVPHVQNRMPAPFGSPFQIRNQPHLFPQNPMGPMGFNRTPVFNYTHTENPGFANQPVFNNSPGMHQHFKPGPGENVLQLSSMNQNHRSDLMFSPEVTGCGNRLAVKSGSDMSPGLNFAQPMTPKQEVSEKNATPPRKPSQILEEGGAQENQAELKGKNRSNLELGADKLNGVLHSQKSPQAVMEHGGERNRRQANNKTGSTNRKRNRTSNSAPSEPVYPCGICLGEVNDDQEAILCEALCQKWFHRVCTGMTETAYNLLTAETDAVWGCDACMDQKDGAQLLKTREGSNSATANIEGQT
ncbi:pygopus homolog 1 [Silurus meridionalis]|uniref:PHD-type domain-containing protein n=1 Tax=Silurus meridionalis TaxID=175797 RepID=A0A8T0B056_SILME|nr:pygopus homolog 1 [Silurus meridionalis]KAF7698774.1 hypothetical protein HF521_003516 [Silurus meridionalis]